MKKLITIIALLLFAVGLNAQSGTIVTFPSGSTFAKYTPVATDTVNGTAVKSWTFLVNQSTLYYYTVTAEFDQYKIVTRSVGNHVILKMEGSIDGTAWVTVDTTLFHPAATGNFAEGKALVPANDVATGVLWKYLKFTATGLDANKCAKLISLAVKIGKRY